MRYFSGLIMLLVNPSLSTILIEGLLSLFIKAKSLGRFKSIRSHAPSDARVFSIDVKNLLQSSEWHVSDAGPDKFR